MATMMEVEQEFYGQTLTEMLDAVAAQLDEHAATISIGEMWTQRKSAVSCSAFVALDKLVYYHKLLTVAHYQLQSWSERNGSETTQPISEILRNWSGGSAALMAAIEAGLCCAHYAHMLVHFAPNAIADILQEYLA